VRARSPRPASLAVRAAACEGAACRRGPQSAPTGTGATEPCWTSRTHLRSPPESLIVLVTAANVQDRDGAQPALAAVRKAFPAISLVWADGGYAGKLVEWAKQTARIVLEIVRKPEGQRTFEVLPRRWVVERTLSWITKCRRLDHDYERLAKTSVAMVKWAMVGVMTRRLAPTPGRQPWTTQ